MFHFPRFRIVSEENSSFLKAPLAQDGVDTWRSGGEQLGSWDWNGGSEDDLS